MRSTSSRIGSTVSWRMNSKLRCPARWAILARLPLKKLSRQMTSAPSRNSRSHRCEPRNPAPPVTSARTLFSSKSPRSAAVLTRDRKHGFDYVVEVVVGHRGINRQGQATAVNVVGDRKICVAVSVIALIVVHRMQRDAVYGASDPALAQHLDKLVAPNFHQLGTEPQHIEMPRMLDARLRVCSLQRFFGAERLVVGARDLGAPALEVVGALQLREADRGVHVGQVVLETHVVNFVEPRAALIVALPRVLVHPVQTRDRDLFRER